MKEADEAAIRRMTDAGTISQYCKLERLTRELSDLRTKTCNGELCSCLVSAEYAISEAMGVLERGAK